MHRPAQADVLRVDSVRLRPEEPPWNFSLQPGAGLWIPEHPGVGTAWLDWLTGIESPPFGEIFRRGVEWRAIPPDEAAAERGRIGCLFAAGGLVVNLDMDENVWLPARMHRRENAGESIERWSRFFKCWPLPSERAPSVPPSTRRRILWTRALAGEPDLLLLEEPFREAVAEDRALLLEAVQLVRARGCAVAVLAEELNRDIRAALDPLAVAEPTPLQGA